MNISNIFCNGNLVNVQTWEVLPPGETGFSRATLRVHFFLDFLFYVPLNTDIVSHFVTNCSSIQQRMRSCTPVVVDSLAGPQSNILYYMLMLIMRMKRKYYMHFQQVSIKEEIHYQISKDNYVSY